MADFNAEMAGFDLDRRRVRETRLSEADSWQRDLGNA